MSLYNIIFSKVSITADIFVPPCTVRVTDVLHSNKRVLSCSEDGTTAWCGISILPLTFIIPMDVAKERNELQTSGYGEQLIVVSSQYKERLLVEVEPQVG